MIQYLRISDCIGGATEHFLLLCGVNNLISCNLLDNVNAILQPNSLSNLPLREMPKALLYGQEWLPADATMEILLATLNFVHASERINK